MKKDSREGAGAKSGADERVEGVTVHSPGRGCQARRGARQGPRGTKCRHMKAARCTVAHSRPVSSPSILPSSIKTRAFLGLVRRLRANSTKDIAVTGPTGPWQH